MRPDVLADIHSVAAYRQPITVTRSFHNRIPPGTQRVVVDTPGALDTGALQDLVRVSDCIVIPVLSSHIDIDAFEKFTRTLYKHPRVRAQSVRIGVVANRVRSSTKIFRELNTVLHDCPFDYVTTLRESQNYVAASEMGVGIHDLKPNLVHKDCEQWAPLLGWLEEPHGPKQQSPEEPTGPWSNRAMEGSGPLQASGGFAA